MTTYTCSQGHQSIDADYCSQCGSKILNVGDTTLEIISTAAVALPIAASSAADCPACSTPRTPGNFCEACGYNFLTGKPAEIVADQQSWQIEISINSQLATPNSPAPPNRPTQLIDLAVGSYLIGRTSQARAIHPQISLDFDDAISHRHALIELRADRTIILRDIGSANGTSLNGYEIPITRDVPLQQGDVVTLGHWTKLTIVGKTL
jgi:FHA domain